MFIFLSKHCGGEVISLDILKNLFLKGLNDESQRSLDLMGKGDVSQLRLEEITELCRNFSRTCGGIRKFTPLHDSNDINKLHEELANFKTDILVQLNTTLDGIQAKTRNFETLSIYCPRCRNKHLLRECPLEKVDKIDIFQVCDKNHPTNQCELLNGIKNSKKRTTLVEEEVNVVNQRMGGSFSYGQNSNPN